VTKYLEKKLKGFISDVFILGQPAVRKNIMVENKW
jgi:hypothetical protein